MALSDSLPQINLCVQGGTQGGPHSGAQCINPEFRVGSNFRIIPEQYFSGMENVAEFLENIDNNLTYYEIPTQLACAYLIGHLTGRALDWFQVLGYRVVEDKATDYAHLNFAFNVVGSIAYHHLSCYLGTLDLNTLSNLDIPNFLELIGYKREVIFARKTPKKICGKVPYRFVTQFSVFRNRSEL
ncbi:uncharacterized protein TNCV_5022861 [Trichonephila clavipes]|nr:uncharacterized protein TNCV_5022861 [Trichonephila clavipes]